ncbi:MAG: maleylpyruvate isomerase family mycothiol-dependent enzyme [Candidatus Dormibacteraeota bacterium]|uniref:Maleylpyruvate isomerase family mycothiol-dependent enzyme n=1 Tax=Candidatus Amunia macphersoniae TaxID=3127014 RepID=A0A934KP21_9BACT|nr:maleylpyruvate isomerase family mycothiol-dependent enzyme [Candidatus Dormibacteraeota bacterium]
MIVSAIAVEAIPPLGHDEAMTLASDEYDRLLGVVDELSDDDWTRPTDCIEWDVKAMLGHVLGMLALQADRTEAMRQIGAAAAVVAQTGGRRLDAMTDLQVREHAHLTPAQLRDALHEAAPRGLAARRGTSPEERDIPYDPQVPGESSWTMGYLFDVIHTRDPWIHRVDVCRATGRAVDVTPEHDGRIVADVVADWSRRHGQPFQLTLTGSAGGTYAAGSGGATLELDAVEFCRVLSGRAPGAGLLATTVFF